MRNVIGLFLYGILIWRCIFSGFPPYEEEWEQRLRIIFTIIGTILLILI